LTREHRKYLKHKFESTPFYKFLGMVLIKFGYGVALVRMSPNKDLTRYLNTLHGAAITVVADSAAAFALLSKVKRVGL